MDPAPVPAREADRRRVRLGAFAELLLLLLPTAALIVLGGPTRVLYFNALSTHDGVEYFGVSLDPLGTTPYCGQPFRYSRMVFPATVFAVAATVSAVLRLVGLGGWLHQRFAFAGLDLPYFVLVHAYVYHGCLVIVSWLSARRLAGFLGSRRAAVVLVGVLLQPVLLKGLLAPLDLLIVVLGLMAIRKWVEAAPTWRTAAATAGVLALALLTREVFWYFVPVLLGCHAAAHGVRHWGKVGAAVLLALLGPALWFAAVGAAQGVNLLAEVGGFIEGNSTAWPFEAFGPVLLAGGVQGVVLASATGYAVVALARVAYGEWRRYRECRRLGGEGLWSLGVLLTFLRAGPLLLDTPGNYGRLLLLAPVALRDFTTVLTFLSARFGRRFDAALAAACAGFLGLVVYYHHARYPAHFDEVSRQTHFLEAGWLSRIDRSPPWIYRH
jgi:hypothetical protein